MTQASTVPGLEFPPSAEARAARDVNPVAIQALRPIACGDLVRLGSAHDGGYVVPLNAVKSARALVSFGLRFDWNFEREFRRQNPDAVVHCYDHTVSGRAALFHSFTELLRFLTSFRSQTLRAVMTWVDYRIFFRGCARHFKQRIWRDRNRGSATVADVLERLEGRRPVFFKIDIEGSEYRIMHDVLAHAEAINAMAVEFHDLDLHPEAFNAAIAAIRHEFHLVHVHANNYGDLGPGGFPSALEITFLNKRLARDPVPSMRAYPVEGLDRPNNPAQPDYRFNFQA